MSLFGVNNFLPTGLESEAQKAARILANFVKPNQVLGADQVIPPSVLRRAKGLAVLTVLKAGFLFSGRGGSGVIVARLKDGTWSGPSAIAMAGAGAGGMIGMEVTDFVFILNTDEAVQAFSEFGTVTFGGNVSVSAGPVGRSAEAAASASPNGVATIFSYSMSKGLFAGVSVEGSAIVERRETNREVYGDRCTSKMILSGQVRPPPTMDPLYYVLESDAFDSREENHSYDDSLNNDAYSHRDDREDVRSNYTQRNSTHNMSVDEFDQWDGEMYMNYGQKSRQSSMRDANADKLPKAVALFSYKSQQKGDLSFKKGDVINIVKKTESQNDWWTGCINGRQGSFPANYVELV